MINQGILNTASNFPYSFNYVLFPLSCSWVVKISGRCIKMSFVLVGRVEGIIQLGFSQLYPFFPNIFQWRRSCIFATGETLVTKDWESGIFLNSESNIPFSWQTPSQNYALKMTIATCSSIFMKNSSQQMTSSFFFDERFEQKWASSVIMKIIRIKKV